MNTDKMLNSRERKLREFDGLTGLLHEARGKLKAYRHVLDRINAAREKGTDLDLGDLHDEVAARRIEVIQEGSQIAKELERLAPGITRRLLDGRSWDNLD